MANLRSLKTVKATTTSTKELLLEGIGKTDAVDTTIAFVIALPSGDTDPTPDPLPDA